MQPVAVRINAHGFACPHHVPSAGADFAFFFSLATNIVDDILSWHPMPVTSGAVLNGCVVSWMNMWVVTATLPPTEPQLSVSCSGVRLPG